MHRARRQRGTAEYDGARHARAALVQNRIAMNRYSTPVRARTVHPLFRATVALAFTMVSPAFAQDAKNDPVLLENATVQVHRSDFDAELLRLPPDARSGFANSERRIRDLLPRMLVTKTLAAQAVELGIDRDPEIVARLRNETERFLAQLRLARVEEAAAKEFDARRDAYEPRARELYLVDRKTYEVPEQVKASHILFALGKHSSDEALALARDARAKIAAGADFNETAKALSEDPSAKTNGGHLGWFARGVMDPAFADAAFKLAQAGDVSEPVLSRFGWHLIRLEDRRAAGPRPFEEVKDEIVAKLRQKYIEEKRDQFLLHIRDDASVSVHEDNIRSLVVLAPDPSLANTPGSTQAPAPAPSK